MKWLYSFFLFPLRKVVNLTIEKRRLVNFTPVSVQVRIPTCIYKISYLSYSFVTPFVVRGQPFGRISIAIPSIIFISTFPTQMLTDGRMFFLRKIPRKYIKIVFCLVKLRWCFSVNYSLVNISFFTDNNIIPTLK